MTATQIITLVLAILGVLSPGLKALLVVLSKNKPAGK